MFEFIKNFVRNILHRVNSSGSKIDFRSIISLDTKISNHVTILDYSKLFSCEIGRCSYIGSSCHFERTKIGSFTSVGSYVLCGRANHPKDFISTYPGFYTNQAAGAIFMGTIFPFEDKTFTNIGSDVWIGDRVIIISGVTIGTGSIIASGSVVTSDVEPFSVVAGVPARVVKYRFNKELIKEILDSKWWDFPLEIIKNASGFANNPKIFLKKCSEAIE